MPHPNGRNPDALAGLPARSVFLAHKCHICRHLAACWLQIDGLEGIEGIEGKGGIDWGPRAVILRERSGPKNLRTSLEILRFAQDDTRFSLIAEMGTGDACVAPTDR